jgi:hypothetical protein
MTSQHGDFGGGNVVGFSAAAGLGGRGLCKPRPGRRRCLGGACRGSDGVDFDANPRADPVRVLARRVGAPFSEPKNVQFWAVCGGAVKLGKLESFHGCGSGAVVGDVGVGLGQYDASAAAMQFGLNRRSDQLAGGLGGGDLRQL